ncbi:hypothetical protein DSL72_003434 [Monilinia vaccinii-corymbosi]|uniref:Uncharacterized protein n=1 Tax=Monilinia vaccinii-corymbosi TaxID=61207 RepID=A0A8A3P903_9HELO|nr:hypothetical protein DSL72_003434 [Monilinia vaccinii-corymbosi]
MNSSSHPQLPSAPGHTALDVKRMLLLSHLKEGTGSPNGIPSTKLTDLSMYDTNTTLPFATAISLGEDECLKSVIEDAAIDFAEREKLRRDIRYYIGNVGNPDTDDMRKSVEKLLDEDIMERGLLKKNPNILKRPIFAKAGMIAADMERKRLGIQDQNYGHDFIVQLMTLTDGWGQGSRVDILKFKLKTSFLKFVATLKDETRYSKIPPESIAFPSPSWPFVTSGNAELQINHEASNSTFNTQDTHSSQPGANFNGTSSEKIPSDQRESATTKRGPDDKGYSLLDGPWMYRLPHVGKDSAPKPGWKRLMNQGDYMTMLDGISRVNSKYIEWSNPSKCSVVVMHSLDRACQQRYLDSREEERAFSIKWEKELEDGGFFDDEEVVGDPGDDWFDYWRRST